MFLYIYLEFFVYEKILVLIFDCFFLVDVVEIFFVIDIMYEYVLE